VWLALGFLRTDRVFRRTYQTATETKSQASEAPTSALSRTISENNRKGQHTGRAKPAASSAAANRDFLERQLDELWTVVSTG
jgi:hypothetical protein